MIKTVCVFCGSSSGRNPAYSESAQKLGKEIAKQGLRLVYGGSHVGLMAALSDAVLSSGGEVTGVITELLQKKVGHQHLTKLYVVKDMHLRKMKMFNLSDAFIALPGGVGTFEEILEIMTWAQLGLHTKPFGFLNSAGYYNKLADFLDFTVDEGFLQPEYRNILSFEEDPEKLLQAIKDFRMPVIKKWTGLS